mgnify:CR=1 FL=1
MIVFVCVFPGFDRAGTWRGRGPAECAAEQEGFRMVKSSVTTREVTYKTSKYGTTKIKPNLTRPGLLRARCGSLTRIPPGLRK